MGGNELQNALTPCQVDMVRRYLINNHPDYIKPDFCEVTSPDIVINNGQVVIWNTSRILTGNIVVKTGGRLTIKCLLGMPKNGKITVEKGGRLIIDGGEITSSCDENWQGIIVHGNPIAGQLDFTQQGFVRLINNATIEYANQPFLVYGGGLVRAQNASIFNSGSSFFYPYNNGSLVLFENCHFNVDGDFRLPTFSEHLRFSGIRGIRITGSTFNLLGLPQSVWNQSGVIVASGSGICVKNCYVDGRYRVGINASSFGSSLATWLIVQGTTFNHCFSGIAAWGLSGVNSCVITNNFFLNIGSHPFSQSQPGWAHYGLGLLFSSGFTVEGNTFQGETTGTQNTIGILAYQTGSQPNLIRRNTFQGLNVANQAEFINLNQVQPTIGLQYWCNTNNTNNYDFYIWDEGIAGIQGEGGNATKNIFSHPNLNAPYTTYEDFNNQSNNAIDYFHLDISNETPEEGYYISIEPEAASVTVSCIDENDDEDPKLTSGEEEQLTQDFNNSRSAYLTQKAAYEALPTGSSLAPELERQMAASKGSMHRVANRIIRSELADTNGINLPKIRTWLTNKESLEAEYSITETYLWEGDTLLARQVRDSIPIRNQLTGTQAASHQSYVQWTELKIGFYRNGKDILSLDTASVLQIQQIADVGAGIAAIQTQSLLNFAYGYDYGIFPKVPSSNGEGLIVPPPGSVANANKINLEELNAVPNPARDEVAFHYSLPAGISAAILIVTDVNAKNIARFELSDNVGSIRWGTDQLPSGIYFYSIRYAGSKFSPRKLVLIK